MMNKRTTPHIELPTGRRSHRQMTRLQQRRRELCSTRKCLSVLLVLTIVGNVFVKFLPVYMQNLHADKPKENHVFISGETNNPLHDAFIARITDLYSSVQCFSEDLQDRTCVYRNFCLSPNVGIFPQYELKDPPTNLTEASAQLSTYTGQGHHLYWRPYFLPLSLQLDMGKSQTRKALFVYAPSAWPNKFPTHALLNHFLPLYRAINNAEPLRRVLYAALDHVWLYQVDVLAYTGGYASENPAIQGEDSATLLKMLGVETILNAAHENWRHGQLDGMDLNEIVCYERIHAGVGGSHGHWDYINSNKRSKLTDPRLFESFRETVFLYGKGCVGNAFPGIRQRLLQRPVLVLLQRSPGGNDKIYGDRVLANIQEIEAVLLSLRDEGIIDFERHVVMDENVPVQTQMCLVGHASILLGVHGNALGLSMLMEPGTVVIEMAPIVSDFFSKLASSVNLHHETITSEDQTKPDPLEIEKHVRKAASKWRQNFQ